MKAGVAELVYACDSKSHAARLEGSSPSSGTMKRVGLMTGFFHACLEDSNGNAKNAHSPALCEDTSEQSESLLR